MQCCPLPDCKARANTPQQHSLREIINYSAVKVVSLSSKCPGLLLSLSLLLSFAASAQTKSTNSAPSPAQNPAPAQPAASALDNATSQRIEQNIRARFKVPPSVKVEVGPRRASELSGY